MAEYRPSGGALTTDARFVDGLQSARFNSVIDILVTGSVDIETFQILTALATGLCAPAPTTTATATATSAGIHGVRIVLDGANQSGNLGCKLVDMKKITD